MLPQYEYGWIVSIGPSTLGPLMLSTLRCVGSIHQDLPWALESKYSLSHNQNSLPRITRHRAEDPR